MGELRRGCKETNSARWAISHWGLISQRLCAVFAPDRHNTTGANWNIGRMDPIITPAFDTDGTPASLSVAEQQAIVAIWRAVAEDFAHQAIRRRREDICVVACDVV